MSFGRTPESFSNGNLTLRSILDSMTFGNGFNATHAIVNSIASSIRLCEWL